MLFFSGVKLLASCPTPNLEDQGVFVWALPSGGAVRYILNAYVWCRDLPGTFVLRP